MAVVRSPALAGQARRDCRRPYRQPCLQPRPPGALPARGTRIPSGVNAGPLRDATGPCHRSRGNRSTVSNIGGAYWSYPADVPAPRRGSAGYTDEPRAREWDFPSGGQAAGRRRETKPGCLGQPGDAGVLPGRRWSALPGWLPDGGCWRGGWSRCRYDGGRSPAGRCVIDPPC